MREQIDGDAAAHIGDAVDDVAPIIAVEKYAVHEQRRGSAAVLGIGDVAAGCADVLGVAVHSHLRRRPIGSCEKCMSAPGRLANQKSYCKCPKAGDEEAAKCSR